jgi:hypothetical protein
MCYLIAFNEEDSLSPQKMRFEKFVVEYGRSYADEDEYELRYAAFQRNMEKAQEMNERNPRATFGVNKINLIQ